MPCLPIANNTVTLDCITGVSTLLLLGRNIFVFFMHSHDSHSEAALPTFGTRTDF